jgi:hypothetical protein
MIPQENQPMLGIIRPLGSPNSSKTSAMRERAARGGAWRVTIAEAAAWVTLVRSSADCSAEMARGLRRRDVSSIAMMVAVLLIISGLAARPIAHSKVSQVSWSTDIAPIIENRCVTCHVAGGFGPMSLATYDAARVWAKAMRGEVLARRMPPWPAARGFGDFMNDHSLTPLEIELITAWADGGTPAGPRRVASDRPPVHAGRSPDLVLSAPVVENVGGRVVRLTLPTGLTQGRWITGWELRPGNRSLIERAAITVEPDAPLGTWTPLDTVVQFPTGVGQRIEAGSRLVLELRYRKSAEPQRDQSDLALYFGPRPSRELRHLRLPCGTHLLDRDVAVLAVNLQASAAGMPIELVARRPDLTVEPLCVVRRYQPEYSLTYRFRTKVRLPAGTLMDVRSDDSNCAAELEYVRP